MTKHVETLDETNSSNNVQMCISMADPSIHELWNWLEKISKVLFRKALLVFVIICWKYEFPKNVITFKEWKYQSDIYYECPTRKSNLISGNCCSSLLKNKIPMQGQLNNMYLNCPKFSVQSLVTCPKFSGLDRFCSIELVLISQIIPFVFIVARMKDDHYGHKRQCVLVPKDLHKIQTISPRPCDEEYLILLALKCQLNDKSVVNTLLNRAFGSISQCTTIDKEWEDLSEESDLVTATGLEPRTT